MVGDHIWHNQLIAEKLHISRQLAEHDKRLLQIEQELTALNVYASDEPHPDKLVDRDSGEFTIAGHYTEEWFNGMMKPTKAHSNWLNSVQAPRQMLLVLSGVNVWPVKDAASRGPLGGPRTTLTILPETLWRRTQAFAYGTTTLMKLGSMDFQFNQSVREPMIFINNRVGEYIGFFIHKLDAKSVKT